MADKVKTRARQRAWERVNRGKISERTRRKASEKLQLLHHLKSVPCADCNNTYPPVCMDFDHRPGEEKLGAVAEMHWQVSTDKLLVEVAKCDVVCSNCHRIRTALRKLDAIL